MELRSVVGTGMRALRRFFTIIFIAGASIAAPAMADEAALYAVDTSSPRATLATLAMLTSALEDVVIVQKAKPTAENQAEVYRLMQKLTSLLDLSAVPPASRRDTARDTIAFLVDVIRRIRCAAVAGDPGRGDVPRCRQAGELDNSG